MCTYASYILSLLLAILPPQDPTAPAIELDFDEGRLDFRKVNICLLSPVFVEKKCRGATGLHWYPQDSYITLSVTRLRRATHSYQLESILDRETLISHSSSRFEIHSHSHRKHAPIHSPETALFILHMNTHSLQPGTRTPFHSAASGPHGAKRGKSLRARGAAVPRGA